MPKEEKSSHCDKCNKSMTSKEALGHICAGLDKEYDPYAPAYTFREYHIPNYMMGGLRRYIERGIHPGDFLTAVICNDLREAVGRADDTNIANLPAYVAYLHNEVPAIAWGSIKRMQAWMEARRLDEERELIKPTFDGVPFD